MAEQEYDASEGAQFTQQDTSDFESGMPRLSRLEARFQDEYLLSANDDIAEAGDVAPYPVDAFYRACERHLRLGIHYEAPEPAEAIAEDLTIRASSKSAKGPSYAL